MSMYLVDLSMGSFVSCRNINDVGRLWRVVGWWRSCRLVLKCLQFQVRHVMGLDYV